ncbi:hypothetical protein [Halomarina oriensis]|uniref:Uncharacterized protein n=1 Tax=Halomarina oriensis TaxID=671145 RepID=A0A6B0GM92_9EURY|nr:hypothetical protein [Halomarina oriensis]MWG35021.1 hypothetical protein [Halomarina oriensis]
MDGRNGDKRKSSSTRRRLLKGIGASAVGIPLIASGTAAAYNYQEGDRTSIALDGSDGFTDLGVTFGLEYAHYNGYDVDYGADHEHRIRFTAVGGLLHNGEKSPGLTVSDQYMEIDARYEPMVEFNFDRQDIGMYPAGRSDVDEFYREFFMTMVEQLPFAGAVSDANNLVQAALDIGDLDNSDRYRTWSYYRGSGSGDRSEAKHSGEFKFYTNDGDSGRIPVTLRLEGGDYFSDTHISLEHTLYVDYHGGDISLRRYTGI